MLKMLSDEQLRIYRRIMSEQIADEGPEPLRQMFNVISDDEEIQTIYVIQEAIRRLMHPTNDYRDTTDPEFQKQVRRILDYVVNYWVQDATKII